MRRVWVPWKSSLTGLSKHVSTHHRTPARVRIIDTNGASIQLVSLGHFLLLGSGPDRITMTIVQRVGGAKIPESWKNDLPPLGQAPTVDLNVTLWTELAIPVPVPTPAPVPVPAPTPVPVSPTTRIVARIEPIPARIAWIVAEDASKREETCAISMEPISPITASVTSCFHCFDTEAINTWLATKNTCPQCRKGCVATQAFTDD